jgi:hypothetical protein
MRTGLIKSIEPLRKAEGQFVAYGRGLYRDFVERGSADSAVKNNLLNSLHQARLKDGTITENDIATESGAIMVAGSVRSSLPFVV